MPTALKFPTLLSMLFLTLCALHPGSMGDLGASPESLARLVKRGKIQDPSIIESSGLVRSSRWPDIFWTHNDSGGNPFIYPIRGDGSAVGASGNGSGIEVTGSENVDWEDITLDDRGYLIIGDIGNNVSDRKTLALYRVKEPDPFGDRETGAAEKIPIYFPERPYRAFNTEALFWARGSIYLLTKTRRGQNTGLYRLDTAEPGEKTPLIRTGALDFESPVTSADASPDGRFLAVLTYDAIWLFERPSDSANYLEGKKSTFPFQIWQCEALAFDGDTLLIGNEKGLLFELKIHALLPVK